MSIKIKKVETISEFIEAIRIRVDVFIIEQQCPPGWEPDELDKISLHFVALVDNVITATARFRIEENNNGKIERMAVKKNFRKKGIGEALTRYIIQYAKKTDCKKIFIQAQVKAKEFYLKLGFKTVSEAYDLWNLGIPHVDMELS